MAGKRHPGPEPLLLCGLAATDRDPGPALNAFTDWDAYMRFIRRQNNVTWRNFNVVDVVPAAPESIELPFFVSGAPEEDLAMDFELVAEDFPRGGKLWLELDSDFLETVGLADEDLGSVTEPRAEGRANGARPKRRLPVKAGKLRFEKMELRAGARSRMQLVVDAPKRPLRKSHDVIARQLFNGEEVGRVTWQNRRFNEASLDLHIPLGTVLSGRRSRPPPTVALIRLTCSETRPAALGRHFVKRAASSTLPCAGVRGASCSLRRCRRLHVHLAEGRTATSERLQEPISPHSSGGASRLGSRVSCRSSSPSSDNTRISRAATSRITRAPFSALLMPM